MMEFTKWEEWEDEYGKWKRQGNVLLHLEPSQKWVDENTFEEPSKEPTEIEKLQQENILLKAQNQALSDRADFHEELIAEMAMLVYP